MDVKRLTMQYLRSYWWILLMIVVMGIHIFLRFYELEERMQFTWDQVVNAWVMKDMLIDHKFPLLGMVAKLNSGIYIGPGYYYLLAPFYWIYRMDPIAAGVFAGIVSIITFFVLFYVAKHIFGIGVALIVVFIHAVSFWSITSDRIAWPVLFIPMVSALIFYFLYRVSSGKSYYLIPLTLALGFSFHIHFTAVLFMLIILLAIPTFKRGNKILKNLLISIPLFILWFIPQIISGILHPLGFDSFGSLALYFHGFHIVRVIQLIPDAVLQIGKLMYFKEIGPVVPIFIIPLFCLIYFYKYKSVQSLKLCYLIFLWFLVPLLVFSLYSGEISDYYFILTRPIGLFMLAFLIHEVIQAKVIWSSLGVIVILIIYSLTNVNDFILKRYVDLARKRQNVQQAIHDGQVISFTEGNAESYLYYYYTEIKHKYGT